MNPWLRFALAFCPREFRDNFESDVTHDATHAGKTVFAEAANVFAAGIAMHLEFFWRDLTYALRTLAKSRMYAVVVITAIALAIACNAAVGSVLEGIILRPLPYPNADRLVNVAFDISTPEFSYPDSRDFRAQQHTLEAFTIRRQYRATLSRISKPTTIDGSKIDEWYFTVLGAHARLGRLLSAVDLGQKHVVISDAFWRKYFDASATAIGRTIALDESAYTIVGVMPPDFRDVSLHGLSAGDYWIPFDPRGNDERQRGVHDFNGWGLLRPGVSAAAAVADAGRVNSALVRRYPKDNDAWTASRVTPALDQIVGPVRSMIWLTYAAALVLLLIACANVTNLTVVRAAARERELVMRTALGASRSRIAAQLTTEMSVLAVIGGVVGIVLGWAALRLFNVFGTQLIPRWQDVHVDGAVLAYVCVLLAVTSIATGIAPALLHRRELTAGLKAAGRSGDLSSAKRMRVGMVIVEIALALGLVTAAGLTVRSFVTLTRASLGFDSRNLYAVDMQSFPTAQYPTYDAARAVVRRIAAALRATPGITDAAITTALPFQGGFNTTVTIPGRSGEELADGNAVDTAYFQVMRIPLLRGRNFTQLDGPHTQSVAIVTASFARHFFGTLDVVGRRIAPDFTAPNTPSKIRTIVGVVGDTRNHFSQPMESLYYLPNTQTELDFRMAVRTDGSHFAVADAVTRVFASVAPSLAQPRVYSYDALFQQDAGRWQAAALLFGVLAGVALLLALAGIYSVTAYSVSQRTQEFGIRKAIGAKDGAILGGVIADALKQAAIGIALGLILAAGCTQLLQPLLFETSTFDPLTYVAVVALIAACALCAALVPAVRATRVHPANALRYE
jgi:putative ABC transport system permease protein